MNENKQVERIAVCCCGQLSIIVFGDPIVHGVCHCDNCRKRTGSGFGISAYFKDAQIRDTVGDFKIYRIGEQQQRSFCPVCGTTVFWRVAPREDQTGIAGGCFVDDRLPDPTMTLANDKKFAWLTLPCEWTTSVKETS